MGNTEVEALRRHPQPIDRHSPEIVCLTETHAELLRGGHAICARPDYGHGTKGSRRKVLLWSKAPWERVDDLGDDQLPPGRFVSGVTRTSVGELTVVGLCIPWSGSRTARFGGVRREWEDHEVYLEHLAGVLACAPSQRLVVAGDFNQRIGESTGESSRPQSRTAHRAALLLRAIPPHVRLATSALEYHGRRTIDHIALSADLTTGALDVISNIHGERRLSDHFGLVIDVLVRGS